MMGSRRRTARNVVLVLAGLAFVVAMGQLFLLGHSTFGSDICFALTGVGLATWVILDPAHTRQVLTGRVVRYGSNALIMSVAFVGLVSVANAFIAQHGFQIDLTEGREFSLSPQSIQVLKDLKDPIHVMAFFAEDDPGRTAAEDLLKAYARESALFTYEFIDPEKSPDRARAYGVDVFGATVFERGERRERVTMGASEENYTAALIRLTRDQFKKVYALVGHEERNWNDESPNGYMVAQQALRRSGYDFQPLNLAQAGTVPADAAVLIVAAPAKELLAQEEEAISSFVERGGGLFVLGDVQLPAPLPNLLKKWGVEFANDAVIDPATGLFGDVSTLVVTKFEFEGLTGGIAAVFFPGGRSLDLKSPSKDVLDIPVIRTSADSWGETNLANRQVNYDAGQDMKGPLTLLAAVETQTTEVEQLTGGKPKVRIVVSGDSDFAANSAFNRLNNGDLFLNAVNWLSHQEVILSVNPHPERLRKVMLTAQDMRVVFYSGTVLLPGVALLLAGITWWRRR